MWQIDIGVAPDPYPVRPGRSDCMYYLRTGLCHFGAHCMFNHPRDRSAVVRTSSGNDPVDQPVCQCCIKTGMCCPQEIDNAFVDKAASD